MKGFLMPNYLLFLIFLSAALNMAFVIFFGEAVLALLYLLGAF